MWFDFYEGWGLVHVQEVGLPLGTPNVRIPPAPPEISTPNQTPCPHALPEQHEGKTSQEWSTTLGRVLEFGIFVYPAPSLG